MRIISVVDGELVSAESDLPVAGPGEVVLRIGAIGVNRADVLQRRGLYPSPAPWPAWPGLECAGTVTAVGEGVAGVRVGEERVALVGGGAYAEYISVPVDLTVPLPAGLSVVEAASVMEAAATVLSMLGGLVVPGKTVLIHGGSGGVGTLALQWAKACGARVLVTARGAARVAACEELGAGGETRSGSAIPVRGIDYANDDFVKRALEYGGADVILDVVGGAYLERNLEALAPGGTLAVLGLQQGARADLNLGAVLSKRLTVKGATLRGRPHEQRAKIVADVGREVWPLIPAHIKPVIHAVMPLEDAAAAHRAMEAGEVFGKIVLVP